MFFPFSFLFLLDPPLSLFSALSTDKHMKVRVRFGPRIFNAESGDDADAFFFYMVRLVRLVLPGLSLGIVLSHVESKTPFVVEQGAVKRLSPTCDPAIVSSQSKCSTSYLSAKVGELKFIVALRVQTRVHGTLLIITQGHWEWMEGIMPLEENTTMDMEVVLLLLTTSSSPLRLCTYDAFVSQFPHCCRWHGEETICVHNAGENKTNEVSLDNEHPLPPTQLRQAPRVPGPLMCKTFDASAKQEICMRQRRDLKLYGALRNVPHSGNRNTPTAILVPSSPSFLTAKSHVEGISAPAQRASPSGRQKQEGKEEWSSPGGDEAEKAQKKRLEIEKMASTYTQLMREFRRRSRWTPRWNDFIAPVLRSNEISVSYSSRNFSPPVKVMNSQANLSGEFLSVYCEFGPVEVRVTGFVREEELQYLADAIISHCAPHLRGSCSTNDDGCSGVNGGNDMSDSRFQRLDGVVHILRLRNCNALNDEQAAALEECLVRVVTSFGCRQVPTDDKSFASALR